MYNDAKFKIKVDLKEKITETYPGEFYQGICRCVEWRNITRASVGIQCTEGLADMSGGNYEHMRIGSRHQWVGYY